MGESRQWMAAFASRLRGRTARPEPSADAIYEQPVSEDATEQQLVSEDATEQQPGADDQTGGEQVSEATLSDEPAPLAE
jgi:hypothetical protein